MSFDPHGTPHPGATPGGVLWVWSPSDVLKSKRFRWHDTPPTAWNVAGEFWMTGRDTATKSEVVIRVRRKG